jgi:hypothetical protein
MLCLYPDTFYICMLISYLYQGCDLNLGLLLLKAALLNAALFLQGFPILDSNLLYSLLFGRS